MRSKFVALSQRVVQFPTRGECGDYLDRRWADIVEGAGAALIPLPNRIKSTAEIFDRVRIDLLVLSGGNDLSSLDGAEDAYEHRDEAEYSAIRLAASRGIPVVGVCRGAQLLMADLGVRPVRASGHVATVHQVLSTGYPAWDGPEEFPVRSFHNWVIPNAGIPAAVEVLALADDGTIEAFHVPDHRQWGFMWHPEREERGAPGERAFRSVLESI